MLLAMNKKNIMYPLKFSPILKSVIWGGDRIARFKNIDSNRNDIGESWEISEVKDSVSVVSEGDFKNRNLTDLIDAFSVRLLGNHSFANFPLLIKLIDARDNLSIQVHPNDEIAQIRHQSLGKTEMWYVIDADPGAFLFSGFSKTITTSEYEARVKDGTLIEVLQKHFVKPGDVFFLPAGRVHAIGKGIFVAEIQQNSNITYRIFDYNRKDRQGNVRQLHTDLAKDVIELDAVKDPSVSCLAQINVPMEIANCKYFVANLLKLSMEMQRNNMDFESFVIYICISGKALLKHLNGSTTTIGMGETVLVPAEIANVTVIPLFECELLECYVPKEIID